MTGHKFTLKGFRLNKKTGKPEPIPGYGLSSSAKIKNRKSTKTRPVKRVK